MILGLDISTSCTGWTILSDEGELVEIGHIDFKGGQNFWEKVDHAMLILDGVYEKHRPTAFYIEESLQGFRPGLSSASTLLTLAKFNGLLSFFMRQKVGLDPVYISSAEARRACGIKLLQKKKHPRGYGHKEQTFEAISAGLLREHAWAERKSADPAKPLVERVSTWAMDECDSYVIARAGWALNKKAKTGKDQDECSPSVKRSGSSRKRSAKETSQGT